MTKRKPPAGASAPRKSGTAGKIMRAVERRPRDEPARLILHNEESKYLRYRDNRGHFAKPNGKRILREEAWFRGTVKQPGRKISTLGRVKLKNKRTYADRDKARSRRLGPVQADRLERIIAQEWKLDRDTVNARLGYSGKFSRNVGIWVEQQADKFAASADLQARRNDAYEELTRALAAGKRKGAAKRLDAALAALAALDRDAETLFLEYTDPGDEGESDG